MLFNSKGKLFGKVSIVDILVVFVLVVSVVGAYFRFQGNNVAAENKTSDFYYTISINEIRETNKNLLEKSIGTDFRLDGKISSTMGTLDSVAVTEAVTSVERADGIVVNASVPEKYNVKLTFKVSGTEDDMGYYTPEMHKICVGKEYSITNLYCSVIGYVEKVWAK